MIVIIFNLNGGDNMALDLTKLQAEVTAAVTLINQLKATQTNPADQAAIDSAAADLAAVTGA